MLSTNPSDDKSRKPDTPPSLFPPAPWCGYVRELGGRWRLIAEGPTRDACWLLLLRHPLAAADAERVVLPAGITPREKRGA